ncbi:MAG: VOC family protein [Clostridiales bacterium]|nr:VOC family protein [Clostridiales bacterium]
MAAGNVTKVLHTGISVYNMQESLEWYKRNLGFELVKDDGYCLPLKAKTCFIEKDGYQIELFEYDEPKQIPEDRLTPNTDLQTVGTKHVAFATDDMDAFKQIYSVSPMEYRKTLRGE